MRESRRYLTWCAKQSKGIKPVRPSENLVRAYLEKSRNALKSMEVNAKAGILDWAVSASYYAKYFSFYALLSKIGVKCEIHDRTIALFNHLFIDSVSPQLVQELRQSKEDRIEMQYYTREIRVNLDQIVNQAKNFVLKIEEIIDSLNSERIKYRNFKIQMIYPYFFLKRGSCLQAIQYRPCDHILIAWYKSLATADSSHSSPFIDS